MRKPKNARDMNAAIQSVGDVSKMLLDNSTREIEKRNMKVYNRARALNKLAHLFLDRLKKSDSQIMRCGGNLYDKYFITSDGNRIGKSPPTVNADHKPITHD
jgi:hypothetical protein